MSIVGTAVGAIPPLGSPSPSPSPAALVPPVQAPLRIADASLSDATPWLSLQNDGATPVDVGGWRLQVGGASAELPDDTVVQAGSALTIHAGEGISSEDEVYLGDAGEMLASMALPGAPVRLTDEAGARGDRGNRSEVLGDRGRLQGTGGRANQRFAPTMLRPSLIVGACRGHARRLPLSPSSVALEGAGEGVGAGGVAGGLPAAGLDVAPDRPAVGHHQREGGRIGADRGVRGGALLGDEVQGAVADLDRDD